MSTIELVDPELRDALALWPQVPLTAETLTRRRADALALLSAVPTPDLPDIATGEIHVESAFGAKPIRVLTYRPVRSDDPLPVIVHIHGGGFVMGTPEMKDVENRLFASELKCAIYSVDYRLAPEAPHPAPLEDIYSVFVWLHANAGRLGLDPARIGIKGESGGGGFAAGAAFYARDRQGPKFAFQHLIYPMIDDRTAVRKDLHPYVGEFVWTQANNYFGWRSLLGEEPGSAGVSAWTCGMCEYCRSDRENLCDRARFTGYQIDGGYAELTVADQRYCFAIPSGFDDTAAAPLLCAGLIGYRTLRLAGEGERIGIYGFGAAAHIVAQVARYQGRQVFAFSKPGDRAAQEFARGLGAVWTGGSDERPPEALDAALIFAPVGALVPAALAATKKGGIVVCGGIHMSEIPAFPYALLWEERVVRSVANLTRRDALEFLALVPRAGITTTNRSYPLAEANQALADLRAGRLEGAAVLVP